MITELWKPISNFENYLVSNKGRIKNCKSQKILKLKINKYGYETVCLFKKGFRKYPQVHRLVAIAFLEQKDKTKNQVNHKDGDKLNNNLENLEWVTGSENQKHSYENGLQKKKFRGENQYAKPIYQIDNNNNILKKWSSIIDASLFYKPKDTKINTAIGNIWKSLNGIQKTAYGFIWRYADDEN